MLKKLLLIVDYQNDFVDGTLGFPKAQEIEPEIIRCISQAQAAGDTIIFLYDTHDEEYATSEEGKNLPVVHAIKGTPGHELHGAIKEMSNGHQKFYKDTFGSRDLAEYLSKNQFDVITLVGLLTNMCVLANAIIAKTFNPNAHIVVDAKATTTFNKVVEKEAQNILQGLHVELI